jgi:phospholipid-transporting ATPase
MQNAANGRYKLSKLEKKTTASILSIFTIQVVMALIGAVQGATWLQDSRSTVKYLGDLGESESFLSLMIKQTGTWILIFTNFVPISLLVTLELVKLWQGLFM